MRELNFYKPRFEADLKYRASILAVIPPEKKVKLGWFHRLCLRFRWVKYQIGVDVAKGCDYQSIVTGHFWRGVFYTDEVMPLSGRW